MLGETGQLDFLDFLILINEVLLQLLIQHHDFCRLLFQISIKSLLLLPQSL